MKIRFLNVLVDHITPEDLVTEVISMANKRKPSYLCAMNAHMTVLANEDSEMAQALIDSDWVVTDGVPVAWAFSKLNNISQSRIAGMDISPKLIQLCEKDNLTISVFGNTKQNLIKFRKYVSENHPKVKIGSLISPPFRKLTIEETRTYIDEINQSGTNILLVSLGCPKQEKWMYSNSSEIRGVCLGIGNAINTIIGTEKRPPKWIQKIGMEWMFRLIQNPKRLFKRYLVTNTKFMLLVLREMFGKKQSKINV